MNLLLVDPYHEEIQVAVFQSNSYVDESILEQGDHIIKCVTTSTIGKRKDNNYEIYLWTQFTNKIMKQFINKISKQNNQDASMSN